MRTLDQFEPLPPYADPRVALKLALPAWRPAERISVTEAAEKYMRVNVSGQWQPFRRDVTPYMTEPTDMIASRAYRGLAFCGPSQSGKTQMLQSAIAYTICADPGRVALFQMTREAAAEFERNKLAPMVRNSPDIRSRQAKGRGADNIYHKLFTGGTQLTIDWPTITKLSSATIRLVLGTDYDHFPESIDGEGDAYSLMRARARTYLSRGMAVVESSPGAPLRDESWRPQTPHDCPPVNYGVLALYPHGTRGRWYWPCPHCGTLFEPTYKRLVYPESADPMEAGEAARMRCPHCGESFGHELKRELNAEGCWLHESSELDAETGQPKLVGIDSGRVRRTDLLSYWLDGTAAAFASWKELVTLYRQAIQTFEATGDEEKLKTVMNTGFAQPHFPRAAASEMEVTVQGLKDKARGNDLPKGTAPVWTRYIEVSVDVQGSRFAVGVTAFGENGLHMPIDRFDLFHRPGAPEEVLKPFEVAEDWGVLDPLAERSWPVGTTGTRIRPVALAVDMHGGGATTDNAYRFYRGRRHAGEGDRWYLTRGEGGLDRADRVWLRAPESASQRVRRRRAAKDILILHMATDRLKDAVMASLRSDGGAVNACLIGEWMSDEHLTEFTAERRGEKGWSKRPGMVRNESLDHLVQARALHIIRRGEAIDWTDPPVWAAWSVDNPFLIFDAAKEAPVQGGDPARGEEGAVSGPARPKAETFSSAPARGGWIQRRRNWI